MGIGTDKALKQQLIFYSIILMLIGLFSSRVLLSAGMIVFLLLTCLHSGIFLQVKRFIKNPFLAGLAILFFIPLLTGFWSEDKDIWWRFVRIKLPLVLLPLAFAGSWQLTVKQWKLVTCSFLLLVFAGCCWSIFQYAGNFRDIHEGYLRAQVIATPFENDHVRFSLAVCLAVLFSAFLIYVSTSKKERIFLLLLVLFFVVFLHILSARTGLVALYLLLFTGAVYLLIKSYKTKWTLAVCLAALVMPLIAWFTVPTFQNRIRYFIYDLSYIRQQTYLPGANDGNRMLSIQAGWSIMSENPAGVGSGDVIQATYRWYDEHIPGMLATDKIYPSSEWMMYGAAAGWAGFLLFTVVMALPFFTGNKKGFFFWFCLNLISAFSFLFDIGLEVQFGVFLYAFSVLWWWKSLQAEV